jgi:SAM-dependent methyltransferase
MGTHSRIATRLLEAILAGGLVLGGFAQTQTAQKPFEPSVGQAGKDVVWVPTADDVVTRMLDIAKVSAGDYVFDLGSGDGRTVIAAAKRGARALGIEFNPDMVELSRANAARVGVGDKAHFMRADIFESDFSEASVVTLFLLPDLNLKLRPKLLALKPGTRIVSNTFAMGEWGCDESVSADDGGSMDEEGYGSYRTALLWIVPARVAGTWRIGQDELVLAQNFQMIEGTLKNGSRTVAIQNGRLLGDRILFDAGDSEYSGRVGGDRMGGEVKNGAGTAPWTATMAAASKSP